jgi:DNA polymerase III subunit delta'
MSIHPLIGHHAARRRLASALTRGKLPQVLLFTGPAGIGKQRLALWLAQLAVCERPSHEPCGSCRHCRLVLGLSHADVHWIVPIPRPRAADPDKQVEEAAEAIGSILEERRTKPLYIPADGMAAHTMATVRLIQRRASLTAVEGGRRIFIIGEADRLVSQEASPEAANALLKLLEEPPSEMLFVLTTVDPRRLLPTIRSRAVPLRLEPLTDAEVREFLVQHLRPALAQAALDDRVALAAGSIGAALLEGSEMSRARRAAAQLLEAVLAGPGSRLESALRQAPWSARGDFTAMLDALAETLGDAARVTLGQEALRPVPPALTQKRDAGRLLQAMHFVADAREAAAGNVNPQILLAVLGEELAEVL